MVTSTKDVVRGAWTELFGRNNEAGADLWVSEEFVDHTASGAGHGPGAFHDSMRLLRTAMPDLHVALPDLHTTFDDLVAEGDKAMVRCSERGTHRAPFRGVPPSGKLVRVVALHEFRISEGKITEHWGCIDYAGFAEQMGLTALPASGQPAAG